jgi:hypothetical protein
VAAAMTGAATVLQGEEGGALGGLVPAATRSHRLDPMRGSGAGGRDAAPLWWMSATANRRE